MSISFDQYQRFQTVRVILKTLEGLLPSNWSILDLGGYPGYLKEFVPEKGEYFYSDVLVPEKKDKKFLPITEEGKVQARDKSFDLVVTTDTLEHLHQSARIPFLKEACRLAKKAVIIITPIYSKHTVKCENFLNNLYLNQNILHHFLAEHLKYKLPAHNSIVQWCKENDLLFSSCPINNLTIWFHYMILQFIGETLYKDPAFIKMLDEFMINNSAYFDSNALPTYRHLYYIPLKKRYQINVCSLFRDQKKNIIPPGSSPLFSLLHKIIDQNKTKVQTPYLGFAQMHSTQTFGELLPPNKITLHFECPLPQLNGLSLLLGTFKRKELKGALLLRLSQHGTVFQETSISIDNINDNSFIDWIFPPVVHSLNEKLTLEIIPKDTTEGKSVTLWYAPVDIPGFQLKSNNDNIEGVLTLKLYYLPFKPGDVQYWGQEKKHINVAAESQKKTEQLNSLSSDLEEYKQQLEITRHEKENIHEQEKQLNIHLQELQNTHNELQAEHEKYVSKANNIIAEKDHALEEINQALIKQKEDSQKQISLLNEQLSELQNTHNELLAEHENHVGHTNNIIAQKDQALEEINQALAKQKEESHKQTTLLNEQLSELQNTHNELLAEHENHVSHTNNIIAQKDQALEEINQALVNQKEESQNIIAQKDQALEEINQALVNQKEESQNIIAQKDQALEEINQALVKQKEETQKRETLINNQLQELQNKYNELYTEHKNYAHTTNTIINQKERSFNNLQEEFFKEKENARQISCTFEKHKKNMEQFQQKYQKECQRIRLLLSEYAKKEGVQLPAEQDIISTLERLLKIEEEYRNKSALFQKEQAEIIKLLSEEKEFLKSACKTVLADTCEGSEYLLKNVRALKKQFLTDYKKSSR